MGRLHLLEGKLEWSHESVGCSTVLFQGEYDIDGGDRFPPLILAESDHVLHYFFDEDLQNSVALFIDVP